MKTLLQSFDFQTNSFAATSNHQSAHHFLLRSWKSVPILVFFLFLCFACSSEEKQTTEFAPGIIPGALAKTGSVDSLVLEGKIVSFLYELSSEDCFNEYRLVDDRTGDISDLTTIVDCRRPHDAEIYGEYVHPAIAGEPFPGRTEIERWSSIKCFEGFKNVLTCF